MLPNLESLRCFLAAADQSTFRAAARVVALSPAAFSDRIRGLEEELQVGLFDRKNRPPTLTVEGERLVPHARRLLASAGRIAEFVHDPEETPSFELTVGTRYELGISWLTPALESLGSSDPNRTVHLSFGDSQQLLNKLRRSQVDAIITSARLNEAGLGYAALHPEEYVFVGPPKTRFAGIDDAAKHTLIDIDASLPLFRYLMDARHDASPWPFARRLWMGTISAIRQRVLAGQGVAVLPAYFIQEDLKAKRLRRLMPKHAMRSDAFRLIWKDGDPREPMLIDLAEQLRAFPLR
jgi:DNA-binding transcriptional LysR family regulator